jgi:L-aspartate oxidase
MKHQHTDILIIGSGLAGLAAALKMASIAKITLITKGTATMANTARAQGGIAAVMSSEDSFDSHVNDTLRAGAGLCNLEVVKNYIEQAPDRIDDLVDWGVQFDMVEGTQNADLTREGGHSYRRVLHFEDHTGAEIHNALLKKCLAHPNIEILENQFSVDLISNKQINPQDMTPAFCVGAYVLDRPTGEVKSITAKATILSTGGAGKVYLYSSNWGGATGDGIAMAYRAGARVSNLEFMQFHPTCLYHRESRNFLISEALRGEGGELINSKGEAFMKKNHPMASLAPRDIVARGIDAELKKSGDECVYLDMTKHPREYLQSRFPLIFQQCLDYGIDMSKQPIPVVPAAHYLCGGVLTDVNGQTDIQRLWALGETACTGFHGANRLASNSLLECLTMAHNCSEVLKQNWNALSDAELPEPRDWVYPQESNEDEMIVIHHMWDEIRRLMWNYVGIVRSDKRLIRASHRLKNILSEVRDNYSNFKMHPDILELRNIATVADLTVECALKRKESRGIHYNLDYPGQDPRAENTILVRGF